MELLWRKFYNLSGGGFVFLYLLTHLSCQISRWADGGPVPELTEARLAHPHFLSLLTFRLTSTSMELVEDTARERERNGTGQRQILRGAEVSLLSAKLQEYKLYTPRWREASRQSIRFDEKQFEQRMKWQEFLIRIMACCPHALTAPGEMCLWSQDMRRPLCSLWVSELHNYNRETDMSVLLRVGRGFVISEAPSQKPDLRYRIIDKLFRS